MKYRARYYRGRVSNFDQSEAGKHCFCASDWLKFETLPRKYRTSGVLSNCVQVVVVLYRVCIVMYLVVYFYTTITNINIKHVPARVKGVAFKLPHHIA